MSVNKKAVMKNRHQQHRRKNDLKIILRKLPFSRSTLSHNWASSPRTTQYNHKIYDMWIGKERHDDDQVPPKSDDTLMKRSCRSWRCDDWNMIWEPTTHDEQISYNTPFIQYKHRNKAPIVFECRVRTRGRPLMLGSIWCTHRSKLF